MPLEQIKRELIEIDSLLRSKEFALEMAAQTNAAYDREQVFLTKDEETEVISKTLRDEKIAINLAGFYAVECAVGLLCERTKLTPVDWLERIATKTADADAVLLLNRFANATWKATQPFQELDRIARYGFTGASYLSGEEIEKDYNQVTTAAAVLLERMPLAESASLDEQMHLLKNLLQDTSFAVDMARVINASYYTSQHQSAPIFLTEADNEIIFKSAKDQKIAMNLAGFYALECGINYLVSTKSMVPSVILLSIENDRLPEQDKNLLLRLANATWKAGQPFRALERITRDVFTPVYFLKKEEIEKDLVQIKTAAAKLLSALK